MPKKHLNDRFIKSLTSKGKRIEYFDQHKIDPETNTIKKKGVKGLLIRLTKAGNVYFYYSYWHNEKSNRYKIGDYPNISLSEAREKAREIAADVKKGIDPQAEKNRQKHNPDTINFKLVADEFKEKHLPSLRKSTRDEYERIIDVELIPKLGKYPINEINKNKIISMLDHKAYKNDKKPAPTMANRIRARLSKIFNFAVKRGLANNNPVQSTPKYSDGETSRARFYSEKEIKKLWLYFETLNEPTQSVLKMLLICGQRKTETMRMRWVDINGDIWTIPAALAKNKQAHEVPFSGLALEIIDNMRLIHKDRQFVFASPKLDTEPLQSVKRAIRYTKRDSGVSDFRPQDLRRTVATNMAKLGVDRTVVGKALNHKGLSGDGHVTAIYDRHSYTDEKRRALKEWNDYLENILS